MDEFIKNLKEALNRTDEDIQAEHKLHDIPCWDSLAILTTLSMLDQEYAVTLSGTELQGSLTVADLYARVQARQTVS